ncbi:MAG: VOC family protein [Pseudomonadota bacterium]
MSRYVFHLSIPVRDLTEASHFYTTELGARLGRQADDWVDVLLWGHQITLQLDPNRCDSIESQGKRHFGVVLPWQEWQSLVSDFDGHEAILSGPVVKHPGTASEQGKLYLKDPSNNVIELKAYRDFQSVLGIRDSAYETNGAQPAL